MSNKTLFNFPKNISSPHLLPKMWNETLENRSFHTSKAFMAGAPNLNEIKSMSIAHSQDPKFYFTSLFHLMLLEENFNTARINLQNNHNLIMPPHMIVDGKTTHMIQQVIKSLESSNYQFKDVMTLNLSGAMEGEQPSYETMLVLEVVRMILEVVFDPTFQPSLHSFRSNLSHDSALKEVASNFSELTWFISGDIKGCFKIFSYKQLLTDLTSRIKDNQFMSLMKKIIKAGYLNNFTVVKPVTAKAAQKNVVGPILSNIYLNKLDIFMSGLVKSHGNKPWPQGLTQLKYIRYGNDFLVGYHGSWNSHLEIAELIDAYITNEMKFSGPWMDSPMQKTTFLGVKVEQELMPSFIFGI